MCLYSFLHRNQNVNSNSGSHECEANEKSSEMFDFQFNYLLFLLKNKASTVKSGMNKSLFANCDSFIK